MNIEKVLNKIYDFCNVQELTDANGDFAFRTTREYSNRLKYIINLLGELNIEYEVTTWDDSCVGDDYWDYCFHNLIIKGTSSRYFTAHYDIRNPNSQNANDNSASIISLIALKMLNPDVNIAFLDAEESPWMGEGAKWHRQWLRSTLNSINGKEFRDIEFILNLEMIGLGGKNAVISDYNNNLSEAIKKNFNPIVMSLPPNDAWFFKNRFDTVCMSTYPIINGEPNFDHFKKAHTMGDNLDSISIPDMIEFVYEILLPLTKMSISSIHSLNSIN